MPFEPAWPPLIRDNGASVHDVLLWPSDRVALERVARSLFPDFPERWNLSHVVRVALSRTAAALEREETARRLSD